MSIRIVVQKGQEFGKLTVLGLSPFRQHDRPTVECLCRCGNISYVRPTNLLRKVTQSCGCRLIPRLKEVAKQRRMDKGDVPGKVKRCSFCKQLLSVSLYRKDKDRADGLTHRCKRCSTFTQRLTKYNLNQNDYEAFFREQLSLCCICNKPEPLIGRQLSIDHDHKCCNGDYSCGRCVRALLCSSCNKGLGNFKDDAKLLRKAADYIDLFAKRK